MVITDNESVANQANRIFCNVGLDEPESLPGNSRDLRTRIRDAANKFEPGFFRARWVKSHVLDRHPEFVSEGYTSPQDAFGNSEADKLADEGRLMHQVIPVHNVRIADSLQLLATVTHRMYLEIWQERKKDLWQRELALEEAKRRTPSSQQDSEHSQASSQAKRLVKNMKLCEKICQDTHGKNLADKKANKCLKLVMLTLSIEVRPLLVLSHFQSVAGSLFWLA